jgi:hypothetical protein
LDKIEESEIKKIVEHINDCITAFRVVRQRRYGSSPAQAEDDDLPDDDKLLLALTSKLFLPQRKEMKIVVEEKGKGDEGNANMEAELYRGTPRTAPTPQTDMQRKEKEDEQIAHSMSSLALVTEEVTAKTVENSTYYLTHNHADDAQPDFRIIPVMVEPEYMYKSGADASLLKQPWKVEKTLEHAIVPWLKDIPRWDDGDKKIKVGESEFTIDEWADQLAKLQEMYPIVTRTNGSNPFESVSYRTKMTSNKKIIEETFNALPAFGSSAWGEYSSAWSSMTKTMLGKFRPDMWGNMVCLPNKIDPQGATNESLCFFDVDHLFPFSRGGQSIFKKGPENNFAAVQCVANRVIKKENLIAFLNPVEMACGISSQQLVAMVLYVEKELNGSLRSRKDQHHLRDRILTWLTGSSIKGESFRSFQTDVRRSTDGKALLDYFSARQRREDDALLGRADAFEGTPSLDISITKCMLEVGGADYYVRERLKSAKYWWDDDRKKWAKSFSSKIDKNKLLHDLQEMACENGFAYKVVK